jgi:hypothetical protein
MLTLFGVSIGHHMPDTTGPLFYQGDVYGRIRFDGNCNRKTCL